MNEWMEEWVDNGGEMLNEVVGERVPNKWVMKPLSSS